MKLSKEDRLECIDIYTSIIDDLRFNSDNYKYMIDNSSDFRYCWFLCNKVKNYYRGMNEICGIALDYLEFNMPTKNLHREIYEHETFIKYNRNDDKDRAWWRISNPYSDKSEEWFVRTVVLQKIKFLKILIKQLEDEK